MTEKKIKREFYQDRWNSNKTWEVSYLSGGYYLRQYIADKQFGRGARVTKKHISSIGVFDSKLIRTEN